MKNILLVRLIMKYNIHVRHTSYTHVIIHINIYIYMYINYVYIYLYMINYKNIKIKHYINYFINKYNILGSMLYDGYVF